MTIIASNRRYAQYANDVYNDRYSLAFERVGNKDITDDAGTDT